MSQVRLRVRDEKLREGHHDRHGDSPTKAVSRGVVRPPRSGPNGCWATPPDRAGLVSRILHGAQSSVGIAVALVVVSLALGSCSTTSSGEATPPTPKAPTVGALGRIAHEYTGPGPKVVILGDSLTVLEWSDLYSSLDGRYAVEIAAWDGEGYNPGKFSLANGGVAIIPQTAKEYAASHPAVAVIALGTNDAWHRRSTADALTAMAAMVSEFQGACLVGVTLPEHSSAKRWSSTEARALNSAMRGWADQVVDWAKMSAAPGMLRSDGIHTTVESTKLRAAAIVAAIDRCAAGPGH